MAAVVLRVGEGQPAARDRNGRGRTTIAREVWGTDVLKERSLCVPADVALLLPDGRRGVLVNLILTYLKQTHSLSEEAANSTNLVMLVTIVVANVVATNHPVGQDLRSHRSQAGHLCQLRHRVPRHRARRPGTGRAAGARRGRAVRGVGRHVPRGRLGAHDRHHPQGFVRSLHGPVRTSPRPRSTVIERVGPSRPPAGSSSAMRSTSTSVSAPRTARVARTPQRRLLRDRGAHAAAGRGAAALRASSRRYTHGMNAHR